MVHVPELVAVLWVRAVARHARVRAPFGPDKHIVLLSTCPVRVRLQSRSWGTHARHRDSPKEMPLPRPLHRPQRRVEDDFSVTSEGGDLVRSSMALALLRLVEERVELEHLQICPKLLFENRFA